MSGLKASFYSSSYIPDRESTSSGSIVLKGNFVVPKGMSRSIAQFILSSADLTLTSYNGKKVGSPPKVPPCALQSLYSPRKLVFYLESGVSFSIPIPDRSKLISAGKDILSTIEASPLGKVACVRLLGEEWRGLVDILATSAKPAVAAASTDPRGATFSSTYTYQADNAKDVPLRFKVQSELSDAPPSIFKNEWETANPTLANRKPCTTSNRFDPRQYIVEYLVKRTEGVSSEDRLSRAAIPVSLKDSTNIYNIGKYLAELVHTSCLFYKGESDRYFQMALK